MPYDDYVTPSANDREISINPSANLNCKINNKGIIEYVNQHFSEVSGYEEYEIIGEPLEKIRHPDMPKIIFEILEQRLEKKEGMTLIAKFLAKDGRFFWAKSHFETKLDSENKIRAHYCYSSKASSFAVLKINTLYKILSKIESKTGDTKTSERYLIGFLEERNQKYNQFIEELCSIQSEFNNDSNTRTKPVNRESPFQQNLNSTFNQSTINNKSEEVSQKKNLFQRIFGGS